MRRRYLLLSLALMALPLELSAQSSAPRSLPPASAPVARNDAAIERLTAFVTRYPESEFRPSALAQLGELLIRRADEEFAAAQRAGGDVPERPDYRPAIARLEELVRGYPAFERLDQSAYTLGALYFAAGQFSQARTMFELVSGRDVSVMRDEALFRLGDSYFELAAQERGAERRELFSRAAQAYDRATQLSARGGDIYFLSLYKLGWSYYNQAGRANPEDYTRAAEVFGRLIREYDEAPVEQQSRLGLRSEAIEYMAVAFTQTGGADAASRYFGDGRGAGFRLAVLKRMAASLRDQGAFPQAVDAYRAMIAEAPTDPDALAAQQEIIAIHSTRTLDLGAAHQARLELVERFAPGSAWALANPQLAGEAERAREELLRQSAQFALARAQQSSDRRQFAEAASLYGRYVASFTDSDSLQVASFLHGEALFGAGDYAAAGRAYSSAAYRYPGVPRTAAQGGQNAIVAFDSALVRSPQDRAAQDSLFGAVDRYVATFADQAVMRNALIQKGRRASEAERWDVMAESFRTYAVRFPNDPYTPTAQKLVGDALYRQGMYADAQRQWDAAQSAAEQAGRRQLVDSLVVLRAAAASAFADSLIARGEFARAAEEAYIPYADANPRAERAPDALRNAVETYLVADSAARSRADAQASRRARERAVEIATRLTADYPTYRLRSQYRALRSELLDELGRRAEAIEGWRELIREDQGWPGRADAMVRVAVNLDSLRRTGEAAQMFEQFSVAYPQDPRAADALFNAAVAYAEAADTAAAARTYLAFATRFPRNARVAQAQQARIALLRAAGDVRTAEAELDQICVRPPEHLRSECADRAGQRAFRQGLASLLEYQGLRLTIRTRAQLTRAGIERLSARKTELLRSMTAQFTRAIETGSPEWLSAATYTIGLLQWDYGNYLRNAEFPADLTEEQRETAMMGAEQQAVEYDRASQALWRSLIEKAGQDGFENVWVARAREALDGSVFTTPTADPQPSSGSGGSAR
jgi:cellulose synthase operon protein C